MALLLPLETSRADYWLAGLKPPTNDLLKDLQLTASGGPLLHGLCSERSTGHIAVV